MLESVSDYLKTKKIRKHAIKKLPYLLRYVPDKYKTQQMWDEAILENAGTLKLKKVLNATKIKKYVIKPLRIILLH